MRRAARTAMLRATTGISRALVGPCVAAARLPGAWRVPVLLYHQVAESGGRGGYPWRVSPGLFEAQMRWLADAGFDVVSLAAILRPRQDPVGRRAVVLTFDDGFRGFLLHAYPVLERYGFPATWFLATGSIGMPVFPWTRQWLTGAEDPEEYRPVSWEEARRVQGPLVALGSHSVTHPHLARLGPAGVEWEVTASRCQIERETGARVTAFAYPGGIGRYGDHSAATRGALMAAGYACALVSEIGRNGAGADPFGLRRLGIGAEDSLESFQAKVLGAYDWVRAVQWAAQRLTPDPSRY